MAIVKISNGKHTLEVSKGAFDSMYKRLGFKIAGGKQEKVKEEVIEETEEEVEPDEEEDAIFLDAISDIPVSKWTKDDVARYARIKGIDTSSASNFGEAKKIIKGYIDNEE